MEANISLVTEFEIETFSIRLEIVYLAIVENFLLKA